MRLLNLLLVLVTALGVGGGYLAERKRLASLRALAPGEAQARYERGERRRERALWAFTAVLVAGAALALGWPR